jgi:hypothetical protein
VLLRDVLPHRPSLRVVLMSATLNAAAFSAYFKGAAVAQIPGFTREFISIYVCAVRRLTSCFFVYRPGAGTLFGGHTPGDWVRTEPWVGILQKRRRQGQGRQRQQHRPRPGKGGTFISIFARAIRTTDMTTCFF